jgi:hypothetical protein
MNGTMGHTLISGPNATLCFQFPLAAILCFYLGFGSSSQVVDSTWRARHLLLLPDAIFWVKS